MNGATFLAEAGNAIVGFCETIPGEILAVFVDPAYKRKGLGAALLKKAWEQAAGSVGVVCLESTLNATLFYEQFGFHEVGRSTARRNDVDVPVVIMERHGKGAEPGRPKWKSKLELP